MTDPLIAVRAIHFAATAMTAGTIIFLALVAHATRAATDAPAVVAFRARSLRIAWVGLATSVISGAAWVVLLAASMSGRPLDEAVADGIVWVVLKDTQFGKVSDIRLALAALLAASLPFACSRHRVRWIAPLSAGCLMAAIAWTGHAAGTPGPTGPVHLTADALHLLASAIWIGGLLPLALLLAAAARHDGETWASIAHEATRRFSQMALISVGTLLATGIVNAWILVGTFRALLGTDYGRLLMVKIGLFAAMLTIAAVNRLRLTPRLSLALDSGTRRNAQRQLTRNIVTEIALGLVIFSVVGALGILHPAIHLVPPQP